MTELLEFVDRAALFEGLERPQKEALARIAVPQEFRTGELIFSEGDAADGFYIIAEGRVRVFKIGADGREQTLHIFRANESFAEVPTFHGDTYPAFAAAVGPALLLFFQRGRFIGLMKQDFPLCLNMFRVLAGRLLDLAGLIEGLSLKETPARVAAYLLMLSEAQHEPGPVTLDTSKAQLATFIGATPETLSRVLARMAQAGAIELLKGRRVRIRDLAQLRDWSEGTEKLD